MEFDREKIHRKCFKWGKLGHYVCGQDGILSLNCGVKVSNCDSGAGDGGFMFHVMVNWRESYKSYLTDVTS